MKKLSSLKKGDLFKFLNKATVYVYEGRSNKKYNYFKYEDINAYNCTSNDRVLDKRF